MPKIGFLGMGVMGLPMAKNVVKKSGCEVLGYDVVEKQRAAFAEAGGIAVEDSMSGLRSADASGATTLGQTGFMRIDNSNGPQFASINGYDGITAATLDAYVRSRNA